MIRFLQTPGPLKKILLGGLLLVICVMMVVTLVPGGILGDSMGQDSQTLAKVGSQQVSVQEADKMASKWAASSFRADSRLNCCRCS